MKHKGHLWIAAGLLCLLGSGQWHGSLIDMRKEFQLQRVAPEDTTPLVSLTTVAFGGFRGLVADVLWVRAGKLQEEGQFFELVQLSKWISQLEPRVPQVWSYQSWNLAYNISVLFPDAKDRWRWVNHGIDLLRKQGLTHNPASDSLHWDLGWMFQHKIGMQFDEAHRAYKQELARQVSDILPDGHVPETLPADMEQRLEDVFSMRVDEMRNLDSQYGPIDWRVPEAHSLYWATRGESFADDPFQRRSLLRMHYGSLRVLMLRGTFVGDPATGEAIPLPRLELLPVLRKEVNFLLEQDSVSSMVQTYAAVLEDCVVLLTEYGRLQEAESLYQELQALPQFAQTPLPDFPEWLRQYGTRPVENMSTDHVLLRVVAWLRMADKMAFLSPRQSQALRQNAREVHRAFQASRQGEEHLARTGLPPWEQITRLVHQAPPL